MRRWLVWYGAALACLLILLISAGIKWAYAGTTERTLKRAWVTHCRATQAQPIIGDDPLIEVEIPDPSLGCSFIDSYVGRVQAEGDITITRDGVAGPIMEIIYDAIVLDGRRVFAVADWAEVEDFVANGAQYEMSSRLAFLEDSRPLRYDIAFMRNASRLAWAESFDTGEDLIVVNPDTTTIIRIERTLGAESIIFLLDYRE